MKNYRRIENKEELEKIISRVLFSTFFHSLQWQEFLEKEFKWLKFEHYLYKDEAILPLTRFKVFGKEKLVSLPFCEYGGPLPLKQGIDFNEFRENILSEFNGNIKIKFHPKILSFFKISKSEEDKFFYDTLSYQIGNLSGAKEQELFQSFRLSIKQRIKKGLDENLTIDNCKTEQDLRDFYRVYVKSMKKNMALCYPFKIFEFLWQKSLKSELVEILIIKHSERVIAGILVVFYSGFAHYFLSGADYKYIEKN